MSLTFAPASRSGQVRSGLVWGFSCQAVVLGCADGIEFTIIRDMSTANLAFIAGKTDWIATTIPLMKDITSRAPAAICEVTPGGISRNLLINRDRPPFNDPEMRRAMALSIDRRAFIDIISEGQGDIGGVMQPLPEGLWGIPEEVLKTLPGYDPDVQKNRAEAREIMRKASAAGRPALFGGFVATMAESDFSCPCIIGFGSSPSRCGPVGSAACGRT